MNLTEQFLSLTGLGAEWVLWLLVALSVFSVSIMVERALFLHKRRLDGDGLGKSIRSAFENNTIAEFIKRHKGHPSMAVQVAVAGLADKDNGVEAVSEAMNSEKSRQRQRYEQNLVVLGTLGNNAPFIGLFGTVLGIINSFQVLRANPQGGIEAVMADLSEALVATAVGLLVAIPAVIAFNWFSRRVRAATSITDATAHTILGAMHAQDSGKPAKKAKAKSSKASKNSEEDSE